MLILDTPTPDWFNGAMTSHQPNPECHACHGTGIDSVFGGECSECEIDADRVRLLQAAYSGIDQDHAPEFPDSTQYRYGQKSTGPNPSDASEKQLAFLARLVAERSGSTEGIVARAAKALEHGMSKRSASEYIDGLMAIKAATPAAATASVRTNNYPGHCADCGGAVEAGVGRIERKNDRWVTFHLVGGCPKAEAAPVSGGVDLANLPEGRYGVPGGDTRLKVEIRRPSKGNWAGWTFVSDAAEYGMRKNYGKVRPGESIYHGDIEAELALIVANPAAAASRYGALTGRCGICNRQLEDEASVARGIGPVCAARVGWA